MTLIPDGRESTADVNALLAELARDRTGPLFAREVEYHPRAYVFGHFDSRGGSCLVLAPDAVTALRHYEAALGFDPARDAGLDDLLQGGRVRLIVCDRPLPAEGGELLDGYVPGDDGRLLARVEARPAPGSGSRHRGIWHETDLAVLWDAPAAAPGVRGTSARARGRGGRGAGAGMRGSPEIVSDREPAGLRHEYRLVPWDSGEDAFGLIYLPLPARDDGRGPFGGCSA